MIAPNIDPIAIPLPAFELLGHTFQPAIRWYGITYLVGFLAVWWLGSVRARRPGSGWRAEEMSDLVFYGVLGVIIGGRLREVIFYQAGYFLANPLKVFAVWEGGMS